MFLIWLLLIYSVNNHCLIVLYYQMSQFDGDMVCIMKRNTCGTVEILFKYLSGLQRSGTVPFVTTPLKGRLVLFSQ